MNMHVASVHEGKKPFMCDICDYNCSRMGNLNKHVVSVHEGKKLFKCGRKGKTKDIKNNPKFYL